MGDSGGRDRGRSEEEEEIHFKTRAKYTSGVRDKRHNGSVI